MDHPCERCGAKIEDGRSFCPSCGAPQIRVAMEPEAPPPGASVAPPTGNRLAWAHAFPAAMIAGLVAALLSLVPLLGLLFFLWFILGGAFAVSIYRRRTLAVWLPTGLGARLGAVTGVFGAAIFCILQAMQLLWRGDALRAAFRQALQDAAARNPDPRAQELVQRMLTPEGLAAVITLTMIMFCVAFVVLGSIGGALGASFGGSARQK